MVWVVNATPRPLYLRLKEPVPLYKRLCGPQYRFGRVRKISLPRGFDPRNAQPVASRYTDYANPAHENYVYICIYSVNLRILSFSPLVPM